MPSKKPVDEIIEIEALAVKPLTVWLRGATPLICNRQSEKAKRQLLLPSRKKNQAEREQTLKHEPFEEFRASPYLSRSPSAPTLLHMPGGALKRAVASAALDIPGASKAQIGRLVSLVSTEVSIWGIPHMRADMVRQLGQNRTPDVRFRCCLPEWATRVTFSYVPTVISPKSLVNLIAAAGAIVGIGDYRVEKGAGDYGKFFVVAEDDEDWQRIVAEGGRAVQQHAMDHPIYFDTDTQELVEWFEDEVENRRRTPDIAVKKAKKAKAEADAETVQ
jgi:hypothetical protein